MLDSSRLFRIFKYLVLVLLVISAVPFLNHPTTRERYAQVLRSFKNEKRLFVADYLESEIDGSFDGRELAKLCASKVWRPEDKALILTCEPVTGGIAAVKNGILHCIRFSIEIGAQLVLPRIIRRSPADISNIIGDPYAKGQPIDYMFSSEHLLASLRDHCPQMRVHRSLDDLYDRPTLLKPLAVNLAMLTDRFTDVDGQMVPDVAVAVAGGLRARFDDLYARELPPESRRYPVRVDLQNAQGAPFTWPAAGDGEAARQDFGRLLRVREDLRVLAASALYNLARRFGLPLDPRGGLAGSLRHAHGDKGVGKGGGGTAAAAPVAAAAAAAAAAGRAAETKHAGIAGDADTARLVGVHLRTEMDALGRGLGFPGYDSQASYFLGYLESSGAGTGAGQGVAGSSSGSGSGGGGSKEREGRVVYLATGLLPGDDDVRRFRAQAAELNATVVTKREVLGAGEVAVLNNHLTWDQRALVDYEILLRVGFLVGVVESSFAWNVAMRRGNARGGDGGGSGLGGVGKHDGGYLGLPEEKPWESTMGLDSQKLVMWDDRYSRLYGRAGRAAVIFKGMWP
ncbi:hypothetical protein SLS53_003282 [Cytospora paraplurivora]|uniref:Alternative oxidase n=1 Tax=Cytospora paraplurivora TaxID=2898453 RepID=A0AAN9UEC9_9PEZI